MHTASTLDFLSPTHHLCTSNFSDIKTFLRSQSHFALLFKAIKPIAIMLDMITLALLRILLPDLEFSLLFGSLFALLCVYAIKWHGGVAPVPFCFFSAGIAVCLSNLFAYLKDNFFWIGIVAFSGFCFVSLPQSFTAELQEVLHSIVWEVKRFCTKTSRENRKLRRENEALRDRVLKTLPQYKANLEHARRMQDVVNERDELRAEVARLKRKQDNAKVPDNTALITALNAARHQTYSLQTKLYDAKSAANAASDSQDILQKEMQDVKARHHEERRETHVLSQKAGQFDSLTDFLITSSEGSDTILRKAAIIVAYNLILSGADLYAANIDHRKVENLFAWVSVGDDCAIRPDGDFRLEDRVYPLSGLQVVGTTIINTRKPVRQDTTLVAAPVPAPVVSSASVPPAQAPQSAPSAVPPTFVAPPVAAMPAQQVPVAAASVPPVAAAPASSSVPRVVFAAGTASPAAPATKSVGPGMARKAAVSGTAGRSTTGRRKRH
ncbi:hypothetical protein K491DRAFT_696760 [Lophiostoma macrostomum CBS 122681]|uniref:Uncharacterized protein n=1 Tax=Lophiostoma macrostomum CBS 122681 TaxID=1314788 RepID=A0A6A6SVG3_9PLEO|nr:hypothetical protein K491DRAFT_696760 [Lophiostoma macrostomum CBS 122681]